MSGTGSTTRNFAPVIGRTFDQKPWEGPYEKKPWHYPATVVIPVLNATRCVEMIVRLWRAMDTPPFIILVDTGSDDDQLAGLMNLRGPDLEVHSLRLVGVRHPSDFPAIAMDLAFSMCRTEYIIATHADCFPMDFGIVGWLLSLCGVEYPVVGYELTRRPHSDWRGMFGHTLTAFHVPTCDTINMSWSLRRCVHNFQHPDGGHAPHDISPATRPNWPDTEIGPNNQVRAAGYKVKIIGKEKNADRVTDGFIDHCRSYASAMLYHNGSPYHTAAMAWVEDAIRTAEERLAKR